MSARVWRDHDPGCEPMGPDSCDGCSDRWEALRQARAEAKLTRAALRRALRVLLRVTQAVEAEVDAAAVDDHPTLADHRRRAAAGRYTIEKLTPLTRARR